MKGPVKVWLATAGTFLLFLLLGWLLPKPFHLHPGTQVWTVRGGLWSLGLVAGVLVYLWLAAKVKNEPIEDTPEDELDLTIAAARNRLAEARGKAAARFGRLPLILVAGPPGSAKTTSIVRSGIEPELLAGEALHGDVVAPTPAVNVWFAQGNLVLEAAGKVVADEKRWRKLIGYVQPSRAAAVLSRGQQAPRVAVICLGCDELLKPGASEAVPVAAQRLRARLAEVSQQVGIRLPVYVIFTKADRLPYFEDYLRSFSSEEVQDVLGATLPILPPGSAGQYAERESRRLSDAFLAIFRSLALRRTDVLARETGDQVRSAAYEFPREFRKVTDLASRFLLELCRPSQLGVSPFLRGFYFTGVRPVLVHDVGAPMVDTRVPAGVPADATGVFDPRALQRPQAAPIAAGSRRVPEWVFLQRIFRDVILRDSVAQGVTGGGTKVTFGRRAVIAAAMAAFLFWAVAMTVSFGFNLSLLGQTRHAVDDTRSLSLVASVPEMEQLQRLDALRAQSARLNTYQRSGNPLHLNWGLYAGDRVQPQVRALYFHKFTELLWGSTRTALANQLSTLPPTPNEHSDYDAAYDALKAYLVTTELPDSARSDVLAPALTSIWQAGTPVDSARRDVAQNQFAFFADELPYGGWSGEANTGLVQKARTFLQAFAGDQQLYSHLLATAGQGLIPYRWTGQVIRNDFEVRPEFTAKGWEKANIVLSSVQNLLNKETWVLGASATLTDEQRVAMENTLRKRYAQDYVNTWTQFLKAASVPGFGNVQDADEKLKVLSTPTSPLFQMIWVVSNNTADSVLVGHAFNPAHSLVEPGTAMNPSGPGGEYIGALSSLEGAVAVVARDPSQLDQAQMQVNTGSQQVKTAVTKWTLTIQPELQAQIVGRAIADLMLAPVSQAENAVGNASGDVVNQKAGELCAALRRLASKFPFDAQSREEATIEEVNQMLAPNSGRYATFYQDNLSAKLVSKSGNQYSAKASNVNSDFIRYLNSLEQISDALYQGTPDQPQVSATVKMETSTSTPMVELNFGRALQFTPTNTGLRPIVWNASALPVQLNVRVGNQTVQYVNEPPGRWSAFRFFAAGNWEAATATNTYKVTWRGPGSAPPVSGTVIMDKAANPFRPGVLKRVGDCVSRVTR